MVIFRFSDAIFRYSLSRYTNHGFFAFLAVCLGFGMVIIGVPILIGWLVAFAFGTAKGWSAIAFLGALIVITTPAMLVYAKMIFLVFEKILMVLGVYAVFGISDYAQRDRMLRKIRQ